MPKKILYVDTMEKMVGGAEISLFLLIKNLDRTQFSPVLLTASQGELYRKAETEGIPAFTQEFPYFRRKMPWKYPASIQQIAARSRKSEISLIHTNCARSLPYVSWASRLSGIPYVAHVRDFVRPWFQGAYLSALNQAKAVIANSRAMEAACLQAGIKPSQVMTIYNPVDLDSYKQHAQAQVQNWKDSVGLPAGSLTIGIVGQIQPFKGQMEFVQACLRIAPRLPDVRFLIVGEANGVEARDYLDACLEMIHQSPFSARFFLPGFQTEITSVFHAIEILAVPSWSEPFGRVVVEGMAAGCAVVASDCGGIPEIIESGKNGLLVPARDPNQLSDALYRLCLDTDQRLRLAASAKASAERFSISKHIEEIQYLYASVLG